MRNILLIVSLSLAGSCAKHSTPDFLAKVYPHTQVAEEVEPDPTLLPEKTKRWCSVPKVHICETSPFSREEVELAYDFFGQEISEYTEGTCGCDPEPGTITFGVEGCFPEKTGHHGVTRMLSIGDCLQAAMVQVNTDEDLVAMHEAAHSVGWMHSIIPGHMMNPYYEYAGWITVGME